MDLPNGEVLMHGTKPYDPKKAHEYYLRTRQLKGRKKGQYDPKVATLAKRLAGMSDEQIHEEIRKSKDPAEKKLIGVMLGNRQRIQGKKADPQLAQKRQAAAQRVSSLQSKLAELNQKLKEATAKARKSQAKKRRGPTQADKSKKARESKQYRDKHKQKLASKRKTATSKDKASGKSRADSVSSIKSDIAETKGRLQKAIARQKALG
jgi:hypothetical protein